MVEVFTFLLLSTVPQPTVVVSIRTGNITSVEGNESASDPGSSSGFGSGFDPDSQQTSPPLNTTTISLSDVIYAGTSIRLTCNITVADSVNTSRELLVEWRKNGSPVSTIDYLTATPVDQTGENSSELIFPLLSTTRDSAVYSCNAVINSTLGSLYVISSDEESDSFNLSVTGNNSN